MSFDCLLMTIISTAQQSVTLEEALDIAEQRAFEKRTPAFPPVDETLAKLNGLRKDTIVWWDGVDKDELRERLRGGLNNVGLVIAVIGEKMHAIGIWLSER